jgi:hypothetical protein
MASTDHELLEEMAKNIAVLTNEVVHVCKDVDDVKHDLYGNGQKGLKQDMTTVKGRVGILVWVGSLMAAALITLAVNSLWRLIAK